MKKFLPYLMILCMLFGGTSLAGPAVMTARADETEAPASQTETAVPETEAPPVLLPTDKVSTEDIILYSSACCVMDADSGEILYYKNMDDKHYPASITKVLTGLLVIENANLNDMITFSGDCWNGLNYYLDMNIGMLDGEQLSVEAALHAILLSSANEVCNGAAKYVSGSVEAFCEMMNTRAAELGCTNTHFVNPNGLQDENHYTSAHDMALISRAAIQNPVFRKITGSYEYTVPSTNLRPEGFVLSHKHRMLMYTDYHYDACIGGKTGYTEAAKNTLVTYAEKNGMTLVCVVMENADGHIYPDTIKALDYCFDQYQAAAATMGSLSLSSLSVPKLPFGGFDVETFHFVSDQTGRVVLPKDSSPENLDKSLSLTENTENLAPYRTLLYPLGTIGYTRSEDGQSVGSQPLYTSLTAMPGDRLAAMQAITETAGSSETAADSADPVPTFIQLQEDTDSTAEPTVTQYLVNTAMKYLPTTAPALIAGFILLTFLLVWLRKVLVRRRHRRNYERLRRERIQNRLKK